MNTALNGWKGGNMERSLVSSVFRNIPVSFEDVFISTSVLEGEQCLVRVHQALNNPCSVLQTQELLLSYLQHK